MRFFLEDEFICNRLLHRVGKEIKKEQLNKVISEIDELNKKQDEILKSKGLTKSLSDELISIRKKQDAEYNIQIQT